SRPRDEFFGIGNETPLLNDETRLRLVNRELFAGLSTKFNDRWKAALTAVYRNMGVTNPSVGIDAQEVFAHSSVPGLYGGIVRSAVFSISRDTEVRDDYTFKGGLDQLLVSFNRGSGSGSNFQYWQYRLDSEHFVPLSSDRRKVIAARALV